MDEKKRDVTEEELREIRKSVEDHISENGLVKKSISASFDERDIHKLKTNDYFVNRYFKHVSEGTGEQMTLCVNMIINSLKWRKQTGIADISDADLSPSLKEKGVLYSYNRDKDKKKLMIFDVKKHFKGKEKMEDMKKYLLYSIERLDREENGDQISLVFDCSGSGIRNMDMEFIQYMLGVFKEYVPDVLNFILVFEMPWVLNAAWKIIKSWLPAAAVKKIKFLNKGNVQEYVDSDHLIAAWGGDDTYEYAFEPEVQINDRPSSLSLPPSYDSVQGMSDSEPADMRSKKVHFSAQQTSSAKSRSNRNSGTESYVVTPPNSSPSTPSLASEAQMESSTSGISRSSSFKLNLLKLDPSEDLLFQKNNDEYGNDLMAKVQVQNIFQSPVVFKIKTTSPDKYRVRPSMCCLKAGSDITVEVYAHVSQTEPVSTLVRDKFLITAVVAEDENMSHSQVAEVIKTKKSDAQYRLRCSLPSSVMESYQAFQLQNQANVYESSSATMATPRNSVKSSTTAAIQAMDKQTKQLDSLLKKMNALSQANSDLREELSFVKLLLYGLILLTLFVLVVVVWRTPVLNAETCTNLLLHTAQANYLNDGILVNPGGDD